MHVSGAEHLSDKDDIPVIVMCNHSSAYDIPVSFLALDVDLRMLAKKELFSIPILSSALKAGDFISIDRSNIDQAKRDLKLAEDKLKSGIVVWIAPEGTRSIDGKLRPFKKGGFHLAIDTRALIVPVVIRGIHQILPTRTYNLVLNGEVEVVIGEPIDASKFSKNDCSKLRDLTRDRMQIMLEGKTDAR
jgi:1-acyl-sn-glycerol-3-phosphate acyltransferase